MLVPVCVCVYFRTMMMELNILEKIVLGIWIFWNTGGHLTVPSRNEILWLMMSADYIILLLYGFANKSPFFAFQIVLDYLKQKKVKR